MRTPFRRAASFLKGSSHHTPFVCGGGWKTSEHIHARPVMWLFLLLALTAGEVALFFHHKTWGIYAATPIPVFLSIAVWSRLRQKPKDMGLSARGDHDPHNLY